jgi:hypothetical protein
MGSPPLGSTRTSFVKSNFFYNSGIKKAARAAAQAA